MNDTHLSPTETEQFGSILNSLSTILKSAGHDAQSDIVDHGINLLSSRRYNDFYTFVNSFDLWSGSDALWEVSIDNKILKKDFNSNIVALVNLMEKTNLLDSSKESIKAIRTAFQK